MKNKIADFLRERGFMPSDGEVSDSINVSIRKEGAGPIFLGTLNFSNPLHFTLRLSEDSDKIEANAVARIVAGGLGKSVSLL